MVLNLFKKKKDKEEELEIPKEWLEAMTPEERKTILSELKNKKKAAKSVKVTFPKRTTKKIRIPVLRTIKRYIAAFLLIINVLFFVSTLPIGQGLLSLLFMLNCFIFLDYLNKTRRKDISEWFKK